MRRSRRATSSWLWRVALVTVAPPTNTGSNTAYGVTAPVRPTLTSIDRRRVVCSSGGELVGDRPPRRLRREAEFGLFGKRVDLDDNAVRLIPESVALLLGTLHKGHHTIEIGDVLRLGVHGNPAVRNQSRLARVRGKTEIPPRRSRPDRSRARDGVPL